LASRPTIFPAGFINQSQYPPAAPKALQAENPPPIGLDHGASARPVGAGLGAGRDRTPGVGGTEEAREGLADDPAPLKGHPKEGVQDRGHVPGVISITL